MTQGSTLNVVYEAWSHSSSVRKILLALVVLLGVIISSGCEQLEPPTSFVASAEKSSVIPEPHLSAQNALENRAPIEIQFLPKNIYENICILGNPFMVKGWSLNPDTRFIYFAGPFIMSKDKAESEPYAYLYKSIDSLYRQRVNSTLLLRDIEIEPNQTKAEELQQFLLPRLTAVDANPRKIERVLGKPDVTRVLKKSGYTRIIYNKRICYGEKLLSGMYFDIANGAVVKAKGVKHPERLKWVISGNRPPVPDPEPTYYIDQEPLADSPQATLIGFIIRRERGDQAGAREMVSKSHMPVSRAEIITKSSEQSATIAYDTLTYQTTDYELDTVEITVAYQLNSGRRIEATHKLRKETEGWRLSL